MQKYYYESFSIESASPKLILIAFKEKKGLRPKDIERNTGLEPATLGLGSQCSTN